MPGCWRTWNESAERHRPGHGRDAAGRDRTVRQLPHRQATRPVLWAQSPQCLRRQADAGLIQAGNPQLRTVLVEAAHRLIRSDEKWTRLAAPLCRRGKPVRVTVAAVANRWVRWLFHQLQPGQLAAEGVSTGSPSDAGGRGVHGCQSLENLGREDRDRSRKLRPVRVKASSKLFWASARRFDGAAFTASNTTPLG